MSSDTPKSKIQILEEEGGIKVLIEGDKAKIVEMLMISCIEADELLKMFTLATALALKKKSGEPIGEIDLADYGL